MWGAVLRMLLAVICGGLIGIEREHKRRPAGFRTHILICLGASLTTLTSQYVYLQLDMFTDLTRLGAQVIAGIGFIGAGTIIVTKRRQVKGLTTAAGLWASAIVGIAVGAGYVEAALIATGMILLVELVLSRFEWFLMSTARDIHLYVEYKGNEALERIDGGSISDKAWLNSLPDDYVRQKPELNKLAIKGANLTDEELAEIGLRRAETQTMKFTAAA